MALRRKSAGVLLAALLMGGGAAAADRTMIVLDDSGSMWGDLQGRPKHAIARESIAEALKSVGPDREVGLLVFGHRESGSCSDIERLVAPTRNAARGIDEAMARLGHRGSAPLAESVRRAAEELSHRTEPATIVVLTDGGEACGADPCAVGADLARAGFRLRVEIVAFGSAAGNSRSVACLAKATGGEFREARDAASLRAALDAAFQPAKPHEPSAQTSPPSPSSSMSVSPAPSPDVEAGVTLAPIMKLSPQSPPLGDHAGQAWVVYKARPDGSRGDYVSTEYNNWQGRLPPGRYVLVAQYGRAEKEILSTVIDGTLSTPVVVLDAATMVVRPRTVPGGPIADNATVIMAYPGGEATGYGETHMTVPAGKLSVTVRLGVAEARLDAEIGAGQSLERDVVVSAGRLTVDAYLSGTAKVSDGALAIRVFEANGDGQRREVAFGYGPASVFDLPPGPIVVQATLDRAQAEMAVDVRTGEAVHAAVELRAGTVAVDAPGSRSIRLYAVPPAGQSVGREVASGRDGSLEATVPEGSYTVLAETDGEPKRSTLVVTAGQRTTLTLR